MKLWKIYEGKWLVPIYWKEGINERVDTWCKHGQLSRKNAEQSFASDLVQVLQQHFQEASLVKAKQNQSQRLYSPKAGQQLDYQPNRSHKQSIS